MSRADPNRNPVDPIWSEFQHARVRIFLPTGTVDIAPLPDGTPGRFLPGATGPIQILTGANPMGHPASDEANRAANRRLSDELAAVGNLTVRRAVGYGGGGFDEPDTWREEGFAVDGLDEATARELATRYRQRAIYSWFDEPGGFRLVACDGSAVERRGWTTTFATDVGSDGAV